MNNYNPYQYDEPRLVVFRKDTNEVQYIVDTSNFPSEMMRIERTLSDDYDYTMFDGKICVVGSRVTISDNGFVRFYN